MTPTEVKTAHDEIWAVREKADLRCIELYFNGDHWCIKINQHNLSYISTRYFDTYAEVNQFLKELP